jgi:hypothetical protein
MPLANSRQQHGLNLILGFVMSFSQSKFWFLSLLGGDPHEIASEAKD